MKRYQLVDQATELQSIQGPIFFETNHEESGLEKLMEIRERLKKEQDITVVMVDTWNYRQIVAA